VVHEPTDVDALPRIALVLPQQQYEMRQFMVDGPGHHLGRILLNGAVMGAALNCRRCEGKSPVGYYMAMRA
jgi:hypothetical protein